MPIYEYLCEGCRQPIELLIRGNEEPVCPHCNSKRLQKQFSVPAAHMSGSNSLPMCETPMPQQGCGLPQCGTGKCAGQS